MRTKEGSSKEHKGEVWVDFVSSSSSVVTTYCTPDTAQLHLQLSRAILLRLSTNQQPKRKEAMFLPREESLSPAPLTWEEVETLSLEELVERLDQIELVEETVDEC